MTERRLCCSRKTCKRYGSCKFGWKIWITKITAEMKKFFLQQDEWAVPPQLIWSSMRRSEILQPKRGYPTLEQVTNCAKYLRRLQGTKNSIHVMQMATRMWVKAQIQTRLLLAFRVLR
ncbi:uncharacterized protein PITG_08965 [Phytophthora infestans T30-4]|uniref:Uncharacterized protein n=1 Tax=Phytophthora infestans (strain T30-4) TaxID=403677 RepID=D0NDL6_PHYIT|nr:uncharacterized protein PITG_08965 [Phytophthora infestans T30-4]EEY56173.1 hypothetical protein PITG_08965 [Phytophthora infestans T30-4]|eukprot:XP_002903003.1 hypothetical protein PITG_08965 [Phytophthora infestans T30-4]